MQNPEHRRPLKGRRRCCIADSFGLQKPSAQQNRGFIQQIPASHLEFGHEAGKLLMPVIERGSWRDDQEGTPDVVPLCRKEKRS